MTNRRALLTDREREIIAGDADVSDTYRYQTISRVRSRFDRLAGDIEALEVHGDLADELREAVCGTAGDELSTDDLQGNPDSTIDELKASGIDPIDGGDAPKPQPSGQHDESDTQPTEATDDVVTSDTQATDPLRAVVEEVAASWEGTAETVEQRKAAAVAVLEYSKKHGGVSKQEAQEEIRPDHDVDGQNADTWYRKNIRPVLSEAGEYDQSTRSYKLTLDGEQQST